MVIVAGEYIPGADALQDGAGYALRGAFDATSSALAFCRHDRFCFPLYMIPARPSFVQGYFLCWARLEWSHLVVNM